MKTQMAHVKIQEDAEKDVQSQIYGHLAQGKDQQAARAAIAFLNFQTLLHTPIIHIRGCLQMLVHICYCDLVENILF